MDFWTKQQIPEAAPQTQTLKARPSQGINFDDFQNFDAEAEEKGASEDLLQSQDFENSHNKIQENFLSNEDFHFGPNFQNDNDPGKNLNLFLQPKQQNPSFFNETPILKKESHVENFNLLDSQPFEDRLFRPEPQKKASFAPDFKQADQFFTDFKASSPLNNPFVEEKIVQVRNSEKFTVPITEEKIFQVRNSEKASKVEENRKVSFKKKTIEIQTSNKLLCSIHNEEAGQFYCQTCRSFSICVQCIVKGLHKAHDMLSLKNSEPQIRKRFEDAMNFLKYELTEYSRKEKSVLEAIENSQNTVKDNKNLISAYFHEIKCLLDNKEKEFLKKVEGFSKENMENQQRFLEKIKKNIEFLQENLRYLSDFSENKDFSLYKLVLEGGLDSLLGKIPTPDKNSVHWSSEEQNFGLFTGKFNKIITKIKDFIENEGFNEIEKQAPVPQNQQKIPIFEIPRPGWEDFHLRETALNSPAKPKTIEFPDKPKISKSESIFQDLRNEIKSISPPKPIQVFKDIMNPFSNKESATKPLSSNPRAFLNIPNYPKTPAIKRSYIAEDTFMRNSFLNKRSHLKSNNNPIKDSRFIAFEEIRNRGFDPDKTLRAKREAFNRTNIEKLTTKKRFFL